MLLGMIWFVVLQNNAKICSEAEGCHHMMGNFCGAGPKEEKECQNK